MKLFSKPSNIKFKSKVSFGFGIKYILYLLTVIFILIWLASVYQYLNNGAPTIKYFGIFGCVLFFVESIAILVFSNYRTIQLIEKNGGRYLQDIEFRKIIHELELSHIAYWWSYHVKDESKRIENANKKEPSYSGGDPPVLYSEKKSKKRDKPCAPSYLISSNPFKK